MKQLRSLGFVSLAVPPVDPVTIAIDGIGAFISVLGIAQARKNARQAQENEVVAQQEQLKAAMAAGVQAQINPATTSAQLLQIFNQLIAAGNAFYRYASGFSIAGPGAIATIFGSRVNGRWTPNPPSAPGYFTQVMMDMEKAIAAKNANDGELGTMNWTTLEATLENIGSSVAANLLGTPVTSGTGAISSGAPAGTLNLNSLPSWAIPVGIVALIVLWPRNSRRSN